MPKVYSNPQKYPQIACVRLELESARARDVHALKLKYYTSAGRQRPDGSQGACVTETPGTRTFQQYILRA